LLNLLSSHSETQLDLLEGCLERISKEQANNDIEAESAEVMQFLIAITEAAHNVVLLHIVRSLAPHCWI